MVKHYCPGCWAEGAGCGGKCEKPDREQIRRLLDKYPNDALERLRRSKYDYYSTHGDYLPELARLLLFTRAELEQAERERDEALTRLRAINTEVVQDSIAPLEVRLAQAEKLAEALATYIEAVECGSGSVDGGIALQVTFRGLRAALADWEQA